MSTEAIDITGLDVADVCDGSLDVADLAADDLHDATIAAPRLLRSELLALLGASDERDAALARINAACLAAGIVSGDYDDAIRRLAAERDLLRAQVAGFLALGEAPALAVIEAARAYARVAKHYPWCHRPEDGVSPCACGFQALLAAVGALDGVDYD